MIVFILPSPTRAHPGTFGATVRYYPDSCPREGAVIKVYKPPNTPPDDPVFGLCVYTNASGQCETTLSFLGDTWYRAYAYYPSPDWPEFGNSLFKTDMNGNGEVTINKAGNSPSGSVCAYVTTKPDNQDGILYMVNVTAFNGSSLLHSSISDIDGTVMLTRLPYGNVTFVAYAKSDYSQIIANATMNVSSGGQSIDLIADQNYGEVTSNWQLIINALSMLMIAIPISTLSSRIRIRKSDRRE